MAKIIANELDSNRDITSDLENDSDDYMTMMMMMKWNHK